MPLTTAQESLRALRHLVGSFRGDEPTPDANNPVFGSYKNRFILNDAYLELNYNQSTPSGIQYSMHGLIGWDDQSKKYVFDWYDSLGGRGTGMLGTFYGDCLKVTGPDTASGGFTSFQWKLSEGSFHLAIKTSADEHEWIDAMEATYSTKS